MDGIVFTSNTGFTARYAEILSRKTGLPVYELGKTDKALPKKASVIFMGWLLAGGVKGYRKAARRYTIRAVCGVGLCDTGCLLDQVRRAIALPESIPLFTLQGGMDHGKLKGIYKSMIDTLTKFMAGKKNPSQDDKRMVELLTTDACYVREENLSALLEWYETNGGKGDSYGI